MSTSGGARVSRRRGTAEANGRNANPARGYENTHRTHELHHRPGRRRSGEEIGKATRVAPGRTVGGLAAADESNALAGVECTNGLTGYRSRPGTEEEAKRRVRWTPPAVERGPSRRSGSSRGWRDGAGTGLFVWGGSPPRSSRNRVAHTFPPSRFGGWGDPSESTLPSRDPASGPPGARRRSAGGPRRQPG